MPKSISPKVNQSEVVRFSFWMDTHPNVCGMYLAIRYYNTKSKNSQVKEGKGHKWKNVLHNIGFFKKYSYRDIAVQVWKSNTCTAITSWHAFWKQYGSEWIEVAMEICDSISVTRLTHDAQWLLGFGLAYEPRVLYSFKHDYENSDLAYSF